MQLTYERATAGLTGSRTSASAPSRQDLARQVDLLVVLGGDGTLLSVASHAAQAPHDVPILAVYFGSVGFLTETREEQMFTGLDAVHAGTARLDERRLLAAETEQGSRPSESRLVFNDVVFSRAALSRMIGVTVSIDGHALAPIRGVSSSRAPADRPRTVWPPVGPWCIRWPMGCS